MVPNPRFRLVVCVVSTELTAKHPDWPQANGVANAARAAYNEAP